MQIYTALITPPKNLESLSQTKIIPSTVQTKNHPVEKKDNTKFNESN